MVMRSLFPPRTRTILRKINEANLSSTCAVQRYIESGDDGEGGSYGAWTTQSTLSCRVNPTRRPLRETIVGGQVVEHSHFSVVFAVATIIPIGARFYCTVEGEVIILNPQGVNGPRTKETERKYECTIWRGAPDRPAPAP